MTKGDKQPRKQMRFDLMKEAENIAKKISSSASTRIVWMMGDAIHTTRFNSDAGRELFARRFNAIVGVYTPGVAPEWIAEDLELFCV